MYTKVSYFCCLIFFTPLVNNENTIPLYNCITEIQNCVFYICLLASFGHSRRTPCAWGKARSGSERRRSFGVWQVIWGAGVQGYFWLFEVFWGCTKQTIGTLSNFPHGDKDPTLLTQGLSSAFSHDPVKHSIFFLLSSVSTHLPSVSLHHATAPPCHLATAPPPLVGHCKHLPLPSSSACSKS